MELTNLQAIGTHFKKENIFLATILPNEEYVVEQLKARHKIKFSDVMLRRLVRRGVIEYNEVDIFYKDEKGYTRYIEEGPDTYVGDNSDGRGVITNVVSAWDYCSEEDLMEAMVNGEFMAIVDKGKGLAKYNKDYNKK